MYRNVEAALLWLIPIAKYLTNKCNLKRSKAEPFIFYKKDDNGKLILMMSLHLDDVFMSWKSDTLEKTKENINTKFNIQESVKVKKFLGVYYEWGHDAKGLYTK